MKSLLTIAVLGALLVPQPTAAAPLPRCDGLAATIVGTHGPDVIKGTSETDWIQGLGGADVISGLGGDDVLCGGRGKDVIYAHDKAGFAECQGEGPERITGGQGDDKLWAGGSVTILIPAGGNDVLHGCGPRTIADYGNSPYSMDVRLWKSQAKGWGTDALYGIDAVWGSAFRDILIGSGASEDFAGAEGNDFIKGMLGSDDMFGNAGDDEIRGDDGIVGNDILRGFDGVDSCIGDADDVKYDCES